MLRTAAQASNRRRQLQLIVSTMTRQQVAYDGDIKVLQVLHVHGKRVPQQGGYGGSPDDGNIVSGAAQGPVC